MSYWRFGLESFLYAIVQLAHAHEIGISFNKAIPLRPTPEDNKAQLCSFIHGMSLIVATLPIANLLFPRYV